MEEIIIKAEQGYDHFNVSLYLDYIKARVAKFNYDNSI